METRSSMTVRRAATTIGEHLRDWRLALGMTAGELADRAGVSRLTLRKIESGDGGVRFESILDVARTLGVLRGLVEVTDPAGTDVARARAEQVGRKRAV